MVRKLDVDIIGDPQCGNCKYFKIADEGMGICGRYPPSIVRKSGEVFMMRPQVDKDDFACGEFKGSQ